jgi:phospholipid/cholesterol/gamma-HCH transport system permease protein
VAIGMVREVGALMTGIIIAGRTGAAFAAQLGTMQVNEEIDAFKTLGISPVDFLVLPRMLALMLMVPLLTLYSGFVGMLAGLLVSTSIFDISFFEYYNETLRALELKHFWVGLSKGSVYGAMVAFAGCLRGMQCGRSAEAVGEAATSAVVTGDTAHHHRRLRDDHRLLPAGHLMSPSRAHRGTRAFPWPTAISSCSAISASG